MGLNSLLGVALHMTEGDFENFIQVPQVEIARELRMHKQNVNKAIKLLLEKDILIRGPKIGKSSSWRLNPNYGYKGSPKGKVLKDKAGHLRLVK
ncbi:MAG: MarR family transcriptional regulator [Alphaproteobacteria bacterium]|nr:MarR family transcriptional regulator [Alphaproteobacteria bacterium]